MICSCCGLLPGRPALGFQPLCGPCYSNCIGKPGGMGQYETAAWALLLGVNHGLTRGLLADGYCPYLHRDLEARLRAKRLREEDQELAERFKTL